MNTIFLILLSLWISFDISIAFDKKKSPVIYSDTIDDLDSGPKEALVQSYLDFREKFKNVDNGDQLAALNAIKEVIGNLNK